MLKLPRSCQFLERSFTKRRLTTSSPNFRHSSLLHRLRLEHCKPQAVSRKLDPAKQQAFIDAYEGLLKTLPDDEAVLFADAVHPTHGTRPVGCWAPKEVKVAVDQTSGRDRLNIHGAIDLETAA
jgi:hypothetical protein